MGKHLGQFRSSGYLLPIVIGLGLGVSVVGITALNVISQNSDTLSKQQYGQLAAEAARAGLTAAITCVNNGTTDWDTGGKPKLQPQTDCHGATVTGKLSTIVTNSSIQTTYTVDAIANPYNNSSRLLTSTGIVTTKDALGRNLTIATKTLRTFGQLDGANGSVATAIDSSTDHTCAVINNQAYCWGFNGTGQTGAALGNGQSGGWSYVPTPVDTSGVMNGKNVTDISTAADGHGCAVASGGVYCWGLNSNGQLGNGNTTSTNSPVAVNMSGVLAGKTVTKVSVGNGFSCVIADGQVYCWGLNNYGQLGNYSTTDSLVPVAVYAGPGAAAQPSIPNPCGGWFQPACTTPAKPAVPASPMNGTTVTALSVATDYACVVASGKAYCWGNNNDGNLGTGTNTNATMPAAVSTSGVLAGKTVSAISAGASGFGAGGEHACAVADGKAYCWGDNGDGKLGINDSGFNGSGSTNKPVAVYTDLGSPFVPSNPNPCGGWFQPACITQSKAATPTSALAGKTVTAVSAGTGDTCALADGKAYCWGNNGDGELGTSSTASSPIPVAVDDTGALAGKTVTAVSAGEGEILNGEHTCSIADGRIYCWGGTFLVGLGQGTGDNSNSPTAVATAGIGTTTFPPATAVDASVGYSCAVITSQAYCWGSNLFSYQLGTGTTGEWSYVPLPVDNSGVLKGKTVTDISSSGDGHSCVVASGKVYCWGSNGTGQLGNNSTTSAASPVAVDTSGVLAGKTVTNVSVADGFSCAVADGQAYCWGQNNYGQLGNVSTTNSQVPVAVYAGPGAAAQPSIPNPCGGWFQPACTTPAKPAVPASPMNGKSVTSIGTGSDFACAVAGGKVFCWGNNNAGQLGNGTQTNSSEAVSVDTSGALNGKTATAVSAGTTSGFGTNEHACAIADGKAYCWGSNNNGELGNNSTTASKVPVAVNTSGVLNGKVVTSISANGDHTCAVASSKAYCWGNDYNGELGNNPAVTSSVPVAVDASGVLNGKTVTYINTSETDLLNGAHTCAVADSKIYCWGSTFLMGLGQGTGDSSNTPVAISTSGVYNTGNRFNGLIMF